MPYNTNDNLNIFTTKCGFVVCVNQVVLSGAVLMIWVPGA